MESELEIETIPDTNNYEDIEYEENSLLIRTAISHLKSSDAQLINLRFLEDKSWEEIRQIISRDNNIKIRDSTLRQRYHRAMVNLKNIFNSLLDASKE